MSFIKDHPTISPVLKLHILNLEAKENIIRNENNVLALQRIEYLSKTRMFEKLIKEVEGLKDLQFPSLKESTHSNNKRIGYCERKDYLREEGSWLRKYQKDS